MSETSFLNPKVTQWGRISNVFDVGTEYLYGIAEATAQDSKSTCVWSTSDAVDDLRVATEKAAFQKILPEIEQT